eukprot:TRINITY_DN4874_c1_g1_i1.p1 TRINITY_DN4874_c1_g1~~TRINITY_DN4874_c1_g1_i1.p1  ORF type:complete len:524 (+),score=65.45 TRINITY_DN4874_c1_g1_i1:80-1573(+)
MAGTAVIQGLKLGLGASSVNLGLGLGIGMMSQSGQKDKKGENFKLWTETDDAVLQELVKESETTAIDWRKVSAYFEGKTEGECRARWSAKMEGSKELQWSIDEDLTLHECHQKYGAQWTLITKKLNLLPGRTAKDASRRWAKLQKIISTSGGSQEKIQRAFRLNNAKEIQKHNKKLSGKKLPMETVTETWNTDLSPQVTALSMMREVLGEIEHDDSEELGSIRAELEIEPPKIDAESLKSMFTVEDDDIDYFMLATPQPSISSTGSCDAVSSASVCSSLSEPNRISLLPMRTPSLSSYPVYSGSPLSTRSRSSSVASPSLSPPIRTPESDIDSIPAPPSASTKMSQTVRWLLNGPSQPAGAASIPTYVFRKSKLLSGLESALPKNSLTVSPEMRMDLNSDTAWLDTIDRPSPSGELSGHVWMAALEPYKCLAKSFFGIREYSWLASTFNKTWCPWLLWSARTRGVSPPPPSQSHIPANFMQFCKFRISLPFFRERAL